MGHVRADCIVYQSTIDAKGQTVRSVKTFQAGFTVSNLKVPETLVPAAAAGSPDRVFKVTATGSHIWVAKNNPATEEPRGIMHFGTSEMITLKAGETLNVAPLG